MKRSRNPESFRDDPWGLIMDGRSMTASADLPNKFTGKEHDDDFGLNWDYFGARYYDAVVGRWLGVDPSAARFASYTPYNYSLNSPLALIDPDGREPVKRGIGSAQQVGKFLSRIPVSSESTLLLGLDNNTNPFFTRKGSRVRYVPTTNGGFIDMGHFIKAAAEVYNRTSKDGLVARKLTQAIFVIGVQLGGLRTEVQQGLSSDSNIRHSAFSEEDIPSNFIGASFGVVFDPSKPVFEQILNFLLDAGAITKEEYQKLFPENFDALPNTEEEAEDRYREKTGERDIVDLSGLGQRVGESGSIR